MTAEEFAALPTENKWSHIKQVMDYITKMDRTYEIRRRMNPHHLEADKKKEERNLRTDQLQRWSHIKDLYATHRDELENTFEIPAWQECKSIIERVFTMELDDALRDVIDE